jgi:hypothetical protein
MCSEPPWVNGASEYGSVPKMSCAIPRMTIAAPSVAMV